MTSTIQKPKVLKLGTSEWQTVHTVQMPTGIYPFLIISGSRMISCQTWGDGTAFCPDGIFSRAEMSNYVLTVDVGSQWGLFVICFM